jgi:hypothetical protein
MGYFGRDELPMPMGIGATMRIVDALDGVSGIVRGIPATSRLWNPDNKLGRVLGQRRDTPVNEKWSGRWESNPRGTRFRAFKTSGLPRMLTPSVISV